MVINSFWLDFANGAVFARRAKLLASLFKNKLSLISSKENLFVYPSLMM
jgi:hypothetical protein